MIGRRSDSRERKGRSEREVVRLTRQVGNMEYLGRSVKAKASKPWNEHLIDRVSSEWF